MHRPAHRAQNALILQPGSPCRALRKVYFKVEKVQIPAASGFGKSLNIHRARASAVEKPGAAAPVMSSFLRAHLGPATVTAALQGAGHWSLGSKSGCDLYIASPLITPADSKCSPDLTGDRSKWSSPRALRPPPFARPCSLIGRTRYSRLPAARITAVTRANHKHTNTNMDCARAGGGARVDLRRITLAQSNEA